MQAVVLAAGEGQRLWPFTATKPKVMIKVADKPVLEYVIGALANNGIFDIILVVGYKSKRIKDFFGDGSKFGVNIEYAKQKQQLGTAHALKQAEKLIEDKFITLPGDNIIDSKTIKDALEPWTLVYKKVEESSKYGSVLLSNGKVSSVVEKSETNISNLANTGIYSLDKEVFERIGDETSLIPIINEIAWDKGLRGVESKGTWMDIVYPWDILKVNDLAMDFSGKYVSGKIESGSVIIGDVKIGDRTTIRANSYIKGPVVIGGGCEIGPSSVIMPSTSIGDNVSIGAHSYVQNSVINDNVILSPGCFIENSVIDRGCVIASRFTSSTGCSEIMIGNELNRVEAGVFIGENCKIGANVVAEPGTIIGNNSTVSSMKLIRGSLPDGSMVL